MPFSSYCNGALGFGTGSVVDPLRVSDNQRALRRGVPEAKEGSGPLFENK
jgi:hypothetical protein